MKRPKKGSWIVTVNCTCTKEIVVEDCTEDEAENDPLAFAVEETEVECDIVRVVKVVANR